MCNSCWVFGHISYPGYKTKPRQADDKHVVEYTYQSSISEALSRVCLLSCVRDGRLKGEGDVVSRVIKVRVWEGVCVTREMSPLHQLGHADMLLRRRCLPPSVVTMTTELARPVWDLDLLLCNSWEWGQEWVDELSKGKAWGRCTGIHTAPT